MKNTSSFQRLRATKTLILLFCISFIHSIVAQNAASANSSTNAVPTLPPAAWPVYKQAIDSLNVPITFYGRVIDQDGKALPGAQVVLRVQRPHFDPRYIATAEYVRSELTTDADGTFALTGITGRGLDLVSVTKPGYELEASVSRNYGTTSGTADNPVPFVLWEKGKKNPLISIDKFFDFVPGRTYAVELKNRKIVEVTNSEGDFQFRLIRPTGVGNWDKFDWSFALEGQHGNVLQNTQEGYFEMLFSPENGYTNNYGEFHRASDRPWKGRGEGRFYIKTPDGQFGKISLIWEAVAANAGPKTNEAGIRIQYAINPTGSPLVR